MVTLDGKVSYPAAKFDRAMSQPIFTPDGKLSYLVEDDRNHYPAQVELAGNGIKRLEDEQGVVQTWESEAGHTAVLYSNDSNPGELYALDGGNLRRLTHHNDALVAELTWCRPRASSHDPGWHPRSRAAET